MPDRTTVHIIDSLNVGGAQTHLLTMLREYHRLGQGRHCVVSLFGDGPIGDDIRDLGIPVTTLDLAPLLSNRKLLAAIDLLRQEIAPHGPDVVEAHLTYSRLLGLFAGWRCGVALRIGFEQGDIYLNSWKFRLANAAGQFLAHRIVVCSQALADWNHRVNRWPYRRMAVLHNCVDTTRFHPELRASHPPAFERPQCDVVFASVGTLGTGVNKRVDVTIRAIAEARRRNCNVGLVVAGDGSQRPDLEALARDLGIADVVTFLGTRSDIPAVLATCDAFCHAAEFEPFGIVCIEAMAMGLPVIVPDSGGIGEAVVNGTTGFVYPALNSGALADMMCRLANDPLLRSRMGTAAVEHVRNHFSASAYVTRLDRIYTDLLAEHQS